MYKVNNHSRKKISYDYLPNWRTIDKDRNNKNKHHGKTGSKGSCREGKRDYRKSKRESMYHRKSGRKSTLIRRRQKQYHWKQIRTYIRGQAAQNNFVENKQN